MDRTQRGTFIHFENVFDFSCVWNPFLGCLNMPCDVVRGKVGESLFFCLALPLPSCLGSKPALLGSFSCSSGTPDQAAGSLRCQSTIRATAFYTSFHIFYSSLSPDTQNLLGPHPILFGQFYLFFLVTILKC